jgi:hypothetical protein
MNNKVFCIGFQKTGTSSMGRALTALGFQVRNAVALGEPVINDENIREIAFAEVPKFNAFQDNPWPILYRELDEMCPDSRFILTIRNEETWLRSVLRHFGEEAHPMQQWVYGVGYPKGNEQIFLDRYRKHNAEVLEYFADRPDDLLVINIEDGDHWQPICDFLSLPMPDEGFPHANKGGAHWKFFRWAKRRGRRILRRLGLAK